MSDIDISIDEHNVMTIECTHCRHHFWLDMEDKTKLLKEVQESFDND